MSKPVNEGANHGRDCDDWIRYRQTVFQVYGVDRAGQVLVRSQLRRSHVLKFFASLPPCVVGSRRATSHYWSRQLGALGRSVKLMPASYVKPYVKRQKNDMADAEAICEAVLRPTMRFVETKTREQQSVLMLHRIRLMLVNQRTTLTNTIRAHMAEFGVVAPIGRRGVDDLLAVLSNRTGIAATRCVRHAEHLPRTGIPSRSEHPCWEPQPRWTMDADAAATTIKFCLAKIRDTLNRPQALPRRPTLAPRRGAPEKQ